MKKSIKILIILCLFFSFFVKAETGQASSLPYELRGYFLINADNKGEAWYVDIENGLRHYLPMNNYALNIINGFGLGISNNDISKIPIAVDSRLIRKDSDGDGLDDRIEMSIGTDPYNEDSDFDSYDDGLEIKSHFNPLSKGRMPIDLKFSASLAGRILLQVEESGEIWYVNPDDNLRYYIGDAEDLFNVIRYIGKGINSDNINKIQNSFFIKEDDIKNIKVDTGSSQRLYYYLGDKQIGSFLISAGISSSPTPKGEYKIINKSLRAWSPYGSWMPYWLGLGTGKFGFHELPIWPNGYREGEDHLGVAVSHGCIRLGIGPARFLYEWSEIGTPVYIY
jgi:hypothetical protein